MGTSSREGMTLLFRVELLEANRKGTPSGIKETSKLIMKETEIRITNSGITTTHLLLSLLDGGAAYRKKRKALIRIRTDNLSLFLKGELIDLHVLSI